MNIESLDRDIDQEASKYKEGSVEVKKEIAMAICILLQGRNFLAKYLGQKQREMPPELVEESSEEEKPFNALARKHVGVYVSMGEPLIASLNNALGISDQLRFKIYNNTKNLITAIIEGQICGVIGLNSDKNSSIERLIRHDLKNRDDFDYESANRYTLPPCADLYQPLLLVEMINIIGAMQEGKYIETEKEESDFDLQATMPVLVAKMDIKSRRKVKVMIADDQPDEVVGMRKILKAWPGIEVGFVGIGPKAIVSFNSVVRSLLDAKPDIVLLDEQMGAYSGT